MLDIKTARPLSRWIMETLTIHFDGGAVVEQRLHLDEAQRIQRMFDKEQEGDFLGWSTLKVLQWDSARVVFSSFQVAEDGGLLLKPGEREALSRVDHPHESCAPSSTTGRWSARTSLTSACWPSTHCTKRPSRA